MNNVVSLKKERRKRRIKNWKDKAYSFFSFVFYKSAILLVLSLVFAVYVAILLVWIMEGFK